MYSGTSMVAELLLLYPNTPTTGNLIVAMDVLHAVGPSTTHREDLAEYYTSTKDHPADEDLLWTILQCIHST